MSKFFFEWGRACVTMSSALSNAIIIRATIHHTKTVFLQYHAFIVFFNTFDI